MDFAQKVYEGVFDIEAVEHKHKEKPSGERRLNKTR